MCIEFKIDGAQKCSRICMCIEFLVQVLKQKKAHVSFPVRMALAHVPTLFRSRPGKPNQRKGQNEKFMNLAHFCEFWCFSLGKQAQFVLECPCEKFMN